MTTAWMVLASALCWAPGDGQTHAVPDAVFDRGWLAVVRSMRDGMHSGRLTEELPGEYAHRSFEWAAGLGVGVSDNLRFVIGADPDDWSVVAPRVYQDVHNTHTMLFFLDALPEGFTDEQAAELLVAYHSFQFGEFTYVIFCPPRAQVVWDGEYSPEPITRGECKANGWLTVAVDDRTPTDLAGDLIRVEYNTGTILVL